VRHRFRNKSTYSDGCPSCKFSRVAGADKARYRDTQAVNETPWFMLSRLSTRSQRSEKSVWYLDSIPNESNPGSEFDPQPAGGPQDHFLHVRGEIVFLAESLALRGEREGHVGSTDQVGAERSTQRQGKLQQHGDVDVLKSQMRLHRPRGVPALVCALALHLEALLNVEGVHLERHRRQGGKGSRRRPPPGRAASSARRNPRIRRERSPGWRPHARRSSERLHGKIRPESSGTRRPTATQRRFGCASGDLQIGREYAGREESDHRRATGARHVPAGRAWVASLWDGRPPSRGIRSRPSGNFPRLSRASSMPAGGDP
jgi:hypothetical protein